MPRLFVYGTLKRGGTNHHALSGQRFVGEGATQPHFRLYELTGYPGMVRIETSGCSVAGEIWDVDDACLARLDLLEGIAAGLYRRVPIVLLPPFAGSPVETYLYAQSVDGCRDLGVRYA